VTTRDAFHRQGPFVGSGGPYSPGPTTAVPPLDVHTTTAGRRSHVILGLGRSFTFHLDEGRPPDIASTDTTAIQSNACALDKPRLRRPRPPFTRTATLFGALCTSLFEARMLPADFCNYHDVRTPIRDSRFLAGTMAMTTFLF
jgi:hypothetical protein